MEREPFSNLQPQPKSIEVKSWGDFKSAIEGWTCLDGEDYCPECWEKFKGKLKEKGASEDIIQRDSRLVSELLKFRKIADGHMVVCTDCGKAVFRPTLKESGRDT